jgi:hypothetical protein
MTNPFSSVCINTILMCKHCGKPLCVADAGPHYCPGSWAEAKQARIADAVELLVSEGYVVTPPGIAAGGKGCEESEGAT